MNMSVRPEDNLHKVIQIKGQREQDKLSGMMYLKWTFSVYPAKLTPNFHIQKWDVGNCSCIQLQSNH